LGGPEIKSMIDTVLRSLEGGEVEVCKLEGNTIVKWVEGWSG
jgi:hypothetical protein